MIFGCFYKVLCQLLLLRMLVHTKSLWKQSVVAEIYLMYTAVRNFEATCVFSYKLYNLSPLLSSKNLLLPIRMGFWLKCTRLYEKTHKWSQTLWRQCSKYENTRIDVVIAVVYRIFFHRKMSFLERYFIFKNRKKIVNICSSAHYINSQMEIVEVRPNV